MAKLGQLCQLQCVFSGFRGNVSSLGSVFLSYLEKSIFVEENERMIFYCVMLQLLSLQQ